MAEPLYGEAFFENREPFSALSARVIVPIVMDLLNPTSVVDVGCGLGSWLAVFREYGVERVLGVDGEWVDQTTLKIPTACFVARDLSEPLRLDERFDLVVSLEVAEHLPPESAETFVESLKSLGSTVLFSAALPGQGGTGHVNERWPDYWVRLFAEHGYAAIDCVRRKVWNDERVEFWYAQNTLVLAREEIIGANPHLRESLRHSGPLSIVHPRLLTSVTQSRNNPSVSQLLRMFPQALKSAVQYRTERFTRRPH